MGCIVILELFYVSNGIFYTEVEYGNKWFSFIEVLHAYKFLG